MTGDHDDSALPVPRPALPPVPVRGRFHDGLEAAEREQFTRPVPKGAADDAGRTLAAHERERDRR
ncbi:hypothetical protein [Streptomyces sp. NPDC020983]|uniref:hypothetical protein n=1 Tax=Streptomyces sp. NPDC020983 TaxID=3365106 RepID=UPI0037B64807